jgi:hypothetical protein|tara:strand:- start:252 stop:458 length:207 start_codon:yes stop_codon:yes gene_type:complete
MSGEQIINSENHSATNENRDNYLSKKRVDINILLNKVRTEKKKERYENIIFVCLVATVIVVTGVIVSL